MVLIVIRYPYDSSDMHRYYDVMSRYIDIFIYYMMIGIQCSILMMDMICIMWHRNYDVIKWGLLTCGSFMWTHDMSWYNYVDGITEACDSSIQIYDMHDHAVPYYS